MCQWWASWEDDVYGWIVSSKRVCRASSNVLSTTAANCYLKLVSRMAALQEARQVETKVQRRALWGESKEVGNLSALHIAAETPITSTIISTYQAVQLSRRYLTFWIHTHHVDFCYLACSVFASSSLINWLLNTPHSRRCAWHFRPKRPPTGLNTNLYYCVLIMAQPSGKPVIQPCRYKTGKTLGAGSYSVVKECVHIDTGRYYAAKVINKRLMAGREHMVRNEIAVLKRVSVGHRNILTLVDYFETMNNRMSEIAQSAHCNWHAAVYLVTDLALGGELFDRICRKGSYYESDAADLIRATLSAVAYLHDHGIVHRDLKPENLLFRTPEDNADLLIADFGLSRIMDEEQFHVLTTTCGTPGYMAPEIFKKTGHGKPV